MSAKVFGGTVVWQSALVKSCYLRSCTPVLKTSPRALEWIVTKRWFASKGKQISQLIRLNTENKLLFGSKQNLAAKTKQSPNKALKRNPRAQNATGKATNKSTKETKDRLEEMYLTSDSQAVSSTEPDMLVNGQQSAMGYTAHSVEQQEIHNPVFHDEAVQDGNIFSDDYSSEYTEQEKGYFHIPKVLPIPKSQGTFSHIMKKSDQDTSKSSSSTSKKLNAQTSPVTEISSEPQLDFILQCPLFPGHELKVTEQAQEFSNMVKTFGLRVLPTVNTVLNKTRSDLSNFFLQRWREKMIKELGDIGFRKHQEATIWNGTNLHACVQQYLSGIPLVDIQVQEGIRGHWDSISTVLTQVKEIEALESGVSHPWLCYKGTFDCVAKYNNTLCVIDWKTSGKPKPMLSNLYDNPLQVVAYLGAINYSSSFISKFGVIEKAAIVVAYPNGEEAHVHMLSSAVCQQYWEQWCQRLHQYWSSVVAEKRNK